MTLCSEFIPMFSYQLHTSFDFAFLLNFLPSPLVIFHGRQITKCVSNHRQGWPFLWKLCYMHCACVSVSIYVTIYENINKKASQLDCQGPCFSISLRKAAAFAKKIHFLKVNTDSPSLLFHFVPLHPHLVSVYFSSTAVLIRQAAAISLSHLIAVLAPFFPARGDDAPAESRSRTGVARCSVRLVTRIWSPPW